MSERKMLVGYGRKESLSIKEMIKIVKTVVIFSLIPAMIAYAFGCELWFVAIVYGTSLIACQLADSTYILFEYRNPYYKEPAYWFIPEWFLRGVGLGLICGGLTYWIGYSSIWVVCFSVGGLLYGYAMQFNFEGGGNIMKHNEVLRGLGLALIVFAICISTGLAIVPIICFTVGTFLVGYFLWAN